MDPDADRIKARGSISLEEFARQHLVSAQKMSLSIGNPSGKYVIPEKRLENQGNSHEDDSSIVRPENSNSERKITDTTATKSSCHVLSDATNPTEMVDESGPLILEPTPSLKYWFEAKSIFIRRVFEVQVATENDPQGRIVISGKPEMLEKLESMIKDLSFLDTSYPATKDQINGLFKSTPKPTECCIIFQRRSEAEEMKIASSGTELSTPVTLIAGHDTLIMMDTMFSKVFKQQKISMTLKCKSADHFYISPGFKGAGNIFSFDSGRKQVQLEIPGNTIKIAYNSFDQGIFSHKTEMLISYLSRNPSGRKMFHTALNLSSGAYVISYGEKSEKCLQIFIPESFRHLWDQQELRILQSVSYFKMQFISSSNPSSQRFIGKHADLLEEYLNKNKEDFLFKLRRSPENDDEAELHSLQVTVFGRKGQEWDFMRQYLQDIKPIMKCHSSPDLMATGLNPGMFAHLQKLGNRVYCKVDESRKSVILLAINDREFRHAYEKLLQLLKPHSESVLVEDFIKLDDYAITRLVMYKPEVQAKLKELAKPCNVRYPENVKIEIGLDISVSGKKKECEPATKRISDYIELLKRRIVKRDIKLEPYEYGFLMSQIWVENYYKWIPDVHYDVRNDGNPIQQDFVAGLLREVNLKNGLKIQIRAGDIVRDTDVDALVCAADSFLQHGGGVAARICIAAGERFKSDCVSYIKQNAQVAETQAVVMNAGNLPNKYIINAVAPVYFSEYGSGNTTEKLLATYRNIMSTAATMKIESIALPAVGAQLFRNPLNDVAGALFRVLQEESQKPVPSVKLIRLVDIDQQVIDTFMALFDKSYNNQNIKKWKKRAIEKPIVAHPNYRWFWEDDEGRFVQYDEDSNWLIDQAYQLKQPEVKLSIPISLSKKGSVYHVIFQDMKQFNAASGFSRDVKKEAFTPAPAAPEAKPSQPEKFEELNEEDAENSVGVQVSYMVTISHLSDEIQDAADRFQNAIQSCTKIEQVRLGVAFDNRNLAPQIRAIMLGHCVKISKDPSSDDGRKMLIIGIDENIKSAKLALYEAALEITEAELSLTKGFPSEWGNQEKNTVLVQVVNGCPEWQGVENRFRETVQAQRIISIERVQNKLIWSNFRHTIQVMTEADGKAPETKLLFHGTRTNTPSLVYDDPNNKGFTMQYCESGMWGRGTYFAQNASYSVGYSFAGTSGRQMFLAEVITGDHVALSPKSDLRMPIQKPNSAKRYTSVKGQTGGSDVFIAVDIVYDNGMAYPKYLITFQ